MGSGFALKGLQLQAQGLKLPNGLVIDEVSATGDGLSFDPDTSAYSGSPLKVAAGLSAGSLANFLERSAPSNVRNFEVGCEDGKLYVRASVRMLLEVRGLCVFTLEIVGGTQLFVRLVEAQFLGVNPRNLIEGQLASINPVLKLDDLPIEGEITGVEASDGWLRVHLAGSPRLVS